MFGWLSALFRGSPPVSEGNLTETSDFWYNIGTFSQASSGAVVSKESAMRQWTVYACISIVSETIAQLPLDLRRPNGSGGTEDAKDHHLYNLVKVLPNKHMTSFNWREAQQANLMTTGNCYNLIQKNTIRETAGLLPINPLDVTVREPRADEARRWRLGKKDPGVVYEVRTDKGQKVFPPWQILHIAGFGFDGLLGESVIINFAKESIGNALALDNFQGSAIKNGITPGGVLEHPDTLGDNKEAFITALKSRYAGAENARTPMVLEEGMKFNKVDVSLVDKQLIEQLKMTATQICGVFKIPPHKVGIYEKNTNYNNTEQGNRAFLEQTMQQWVVRWEQAMNWKLLSPTERDQGYEFKFNFDALLRPDTKTRSELEWREWQMGTPLNEIRRRNDLNPIEGQDVSYVPVNMVPWHLAGQAVAQEQNDPAEEELDKIKRFEKNAVARVFEKVAKGKAIDIQAELEKVYDKVNRFVDESILPIKLLQLDQESAQERIDQIKGEFADNKKRLLEAQDER